MTEASSQVMTNAYLLIYLEWSDLYQAPLQVSKSVSGPTIFRFSFISVPVFNQKVFDFLVTRPPSSCHKSVSGPIIFRFHLGSSVQPKKCFDLFARFPNCGLMSHRWQAPCRCQSQFQHLTFFGSFSFRFQCRTTKCSIVSWCV